MNREPAPLCDKNVIHQDNVNSVAAQMPGDELVYDISELFSAFSDSTRARILWALSLGELCVCDLAAVLNMTSGAISHQLRLLKQFRLVKFRREGKVVYYSLADDHVNTMLAMAVEHVSEERA